MSSLVCAVAAGIALFIPMAGAGMLRYGLCAGFASAGTVLAFLGRQTSWLVDKPRPITPLVGIWLNLPLAVLASAFWWVVSNMRM